MMKSAVLLFLMLVPLALAQNNSPPISNVSQYNSAQASQLNTFFDNSTSQSGQITVIYGTYSQIIHINASTDISGMSVMVDNSTYPMNNLALIIAHGYQEGHLTALPSNGYPNFICDLNWYRNMTQQTVWRCDFDNDGCPEYENNTVVNYAINANFTFRNLSESVPLSSNVIPVPSDILSEMENSSGKENLSVTLKGNIIFTYVIDNQVFLGGTNCGDNYTNYSASIPISLTKNFTVSGTNKLFFLRSPVLREQWILDNRFDMVVLSQSPLYFAQIDLNGTQVANYSFRNFSVVTDQYGLEEIVSNRTNQTGYSENQNLSTPIPLEGSNNSFSYIYEFNYSYAGEEIGQNNLSLLVNDSFLGQGNFSDFLSSRYLSYNNSVSETGVSSSLVPTRPSGTFTTDTLGHFELGLGLVAFVLILAFVNFWLIH